MILHAVPSIHECMDGRGVITACTRDCPDSCSLVVSSDVAGRVRIRGNPDHPVTRGFICAKVRDHMRRIASPYRIVHPLLRQGATWRRIGWDEALGICAERIQALRAEPASILYFHGEGAKGVLKQVGHLFFVLLEASRVRGSFCDSAGYSACVRDFGSRRTSDITTLREARSIAVWGRDLSRSSLHMAALVQESRKSGAYVLSISPGGDGTRVLADRVLCIRPGTDRFLAAAVIRLLCEEGSIPDAVASASSNGAEFRSMILERPLGDLLGACGCSLDDARALRDLYTARRPAASIIGTGVQRYRFGGENVRFINALAFISGNIGISGGGSHYHMNSLRNLNLSWTRTAVREGVRFLRMPLIGREIAEAHDPPIRMLWVDGSNLVNQAPGARDTARALEQVGFTVVVDAFMTDTAARADLVLPCALMLEQEDIVASYMHDYVQYAAQAIVPRGEARSDFAILADLGGRLDPPVVLPGAQDCLRESLRSPFLHTTLEEIREKGFVRAVHPAVAYQGLVFDHEDGAYRFPPELHDEPDPPDGYPLRLLSLIRREAMHSQILPEDHRMPPTVWVSRDDPALEGIDRGRPVALVTQLGRLRVVLRTREDLHPGTVLYRRGDWMRLGGGVNRLIEPRLTDMGTGTAYYDQYARIEND